MVLATENETVSVARSHRRARHSQSIRRTRAVGLRVATSVERKTGGDVPVGLLRSYTERLATVE